MSLFGKILAVLNLMALCAFLYLAVVDFQVRQAWTYAVFRWDLALEGLPVDPDEPDGRNRLRHLDLSENETLCEELVGKSTLPDERRIVTLEDFLAQRKQQILARIDDKTNIKGTSVEKTCEVLMQLAQTAGEREKLQALKFDRSPGLAEKLRKQLENQFEALKKLPVTEDGKKDRDAKKMAIARALLCVVDVLPSDAERQKRGPDPTGDDTYKHTRNALGLRLLMRSLDLQARELLTMSIATDNARQGERHYFVYQHQNLINQIIGQEHELQEQKTQLAIVVGQAKLQDARAIAQNVLVDEKTIELETLRDQTAKGQFDAKGNLKRDAKTGELTGPGLAQLEQEQLKVFRLRLMLRDANRENQQMEQQIRELEVQKAQKGGE